MAKKHVVVALDGPAASGKSTVGVLLARKLELTFVDSGVFYRALAVLARQRGITEVDSASLIELASNAQIRLEGDQVIANNEDITGHLRDQANNNLLSALSAVPQVREYLTTMLRSTSQSGVVMAGRDIGTVVFPNAPYKYFITASENERVKRRQIQMGIGESSQAATDVLGRDKKDSSRKASPLKAAEDAIIINTDNMDAPAVVTHILDSIKSKEEKNPTLESNAWEI